MLIIYPSYNNYDLMFGENKNFLSKNSEKIIVIDDHSTPVEREKGRRFSESLGLKFFMNPGKGVQSAVDYVINNFCSDGEWVVVMQQDVCFQDEDAVFKLSEQLSKINKLAYPIGAVGFPNYVVNSHYHRSLEEGVKVTWRDCWLGVLMLTQSKFYKTNKLSNYVYRFLSLCPFIEKIERRFWHKVIFHRNFAPLTFPNFSEAASSYEGLTAIDLPVWTVIAISSSAWKSAVKPDPNFIFHLWFADVAMQMQSNNFFVCLDTNIIVINNWQVKTLYGIDGSVEEGKKKNGRMERYGNHLEVWKKKWGYDYEHPFPSKKQMHQVRGIISQFKLNDPKFPIKKFKI